MDYVRHAPVSRSKNYEIKDADITYLHKNKPWSLQQSVEEGCYVCTAICHQLLTRGKLDNCSFANICLTSSTVTLHLYESSSSEVSFKWQVMLADSDDDGEVVFTVYRHHIDSTSSIFGPHVGFTRQSDCGADTIHEYQPVADTMSSPLWELITKWIKRCSSGHQCSHNTGNGAFPARLVEVHMTDTGLEAHLVETSEEGFTRGYECFPL